MKSSFLYFSWAVSCLFLGLWDFFALKQAAQTTVANDFILLLPALIGAIGLLLYPLGKAQNAQAEQLQQFLVFFSGFSILHRMIWILPMTLGFGSRNLSLLIIILGIISYYWQSQKQSA